MTDEFVTSIKYHRDSNGQFVATTRYLASLRSAAQTRRTPVPENESVDTPEIPWQYYETDLTVFYDSVPEGLIKTCEHRHITLEDAWRCSLEWDPEDPLDVLCIRDGHVAIRHLGAEYYN